MIDSFITLCVDYNIIQTMVNRIFMSEKYLNIILNLVNLDKLNKNNILTELFKNNL